MKKKICPICDTEMKSGSYCRVCRSFVWHPRIEERNYYLNEERSSAKMAALHSDTSQTQQKIQPQTYRRTVTQSNRQPVRPTIQRKYENREQNARNLSGLKSFALFLSVILAISIVMAVMQNVRNKYNSETVWEEGLEPGWEEGNIQGVEVYEFDAQQIRDAGERCTGSFHAEISLDVAKELTEQFLLEQSIVDYYIEESSDNTLNRYNGGYEETYYNTMTNYHYSVRSGVEEGIIGIGSDTGSGELHYFELVSENLDMVIAAARIFTEAVDSSDHNLSVDTEEIQYEIVEHEQSDPEWEDAYWLEGDNWFLYLIKIDGGYYFVLNPEDVFE